jgi:enoyl-CoA hydratase
MIDVAEQGEVAVVTLHHGKANALDTALCEALTLRFEKLRDSSSRAVVLSGQGRIFSAGVDLPRLLDGGVDYIRVFLPALDRLYGAIFNFPKPVVAAVNGHAIAGGCVLACCADRRMMARDGGRMGVTEILVGVPLPPMAFEVMRATTSVRLLPEAMLTGATYPPEQAITRGWIDELAERAELIDRAVDTAAVLARLSPEAFAMTKRQLRQAAAERMQRDGAMLAAEVEAIWTAPQTLERMRDFVARTLSKT